MFRTGQLIKASVNRFPLLNHYGIILVDNGQVKVLHNTPFRSSVIDDLHFWLSTRKLITVDDTELVNYSRDFILDRFNMVCKNRYNLFFYNCEHFIDCMLSREQRSEQLSMWLPFMALLVILVLIGFNWR